MCGKNIGNAKMAMWRLIFWGIKNKLIFQYAASKTWQDHFLAFQKEIMHIGSAVLTKLAFSQISWFLKAKIALKLGWVKIKIEILFIKDNFFSIIDI